MSFLKNLFSGSSSHNTESLKQMLADGAILVDVRSSEEFRSGHAKKSINIPLQMLVQSKNKLKGKTVITICRSGARSAMAVDLLKKEGITAYNGGAWNNWQ